MTPENPHDGRHRRRRLFLRLVWLRRRRQFHALRMAMLAAAMATALVATALIAPSAHVMALDDEYTAECGNAFIWPVQTIDADPPLGETFDNPPEPWLPGHRGVDILAQTGTELLAPSDGRIAFAGSVAGKSVVTIIHADDLSTTYEPARTWLPVGRAVEEGTPFATLEGHSDHCDGTCLHWGLRRNRGAAMHYLDPVRQVHRQRIVLKPL